MDKDKIDEEQVKLAERYADVLQDIRRLEKEMSWGEDDIDMACDYLAILNEIEEHLEKEKSWCKDDVNQASDYLATLKEIEKTDAKTD